MTVLLIVIVVPNEIYQKSGQKCYIITTSFINIQNLKGICVEVTEISSPEVKSNRQG
jgi:hypothetical protein